MTAVLAPQDSALLGLVSVLAPAIVSGNTAVLVASDGRPPEPLYLQAVKPGTPVIVLPGGAFLNLAIDNEGWEHTGDTDLFDIHDYVKSGEDLYNKYKDITPRSETVPKNGRAALIDGYQRIRALTFEVKVDLVESLGADKYLYFTTTGPAVHAAQLDELEAEGEVHENHFVARVPAESKAAVGQSIELAFDTTKLAVFDADSGANLTISPPAAE